ncbi:MAG: hypothetical protein V4481_02115 [Patescibacteria group bacterium]
MKITFLPYSNELDYSQAIKEFEEIWATYGEKIIQGWENSTGFKYRETEMNALVYNGISHAPPLALRYNVELDRKKSTLVHELGHCLLNRRLKATDTETVHKILFLPLFDLFKEIFGEQFLKETIEWDSKLHPKYKMAWEFAGSFQNKEERLGKFGEMIEVFK